MQESSNIPAQISTVEIIDLIYSGRIQPAHIILLQKEFLWNDQALADILQVGMEKIGSWKLSESGIEERFQEHIILLLSLFEQGKEVFGSAADFRKWLYSENFHFEGNQPLTYLKLIHGIKFVSARLTGMEWGDNA